MKLILVTACPQGLATSFLAARALSRAARSRGWDVTQEVHSQAAPVEAVSAEAIAAADLIVIAASAPLDLSRFEGKPLFRAPVTAPLADPDAFLDHGAGRVAFPLELELAGPGRQLALALGPDAAEVPERPGRPEEEHVQPEREHGLVFTEPDFVRRVFVARVRELLHGPPDRLVVLAAELANDQLAHSAIRTSS